jgi:hypothetical protein
VQPKKVKKQTVSPLPNSKCVVVAPKPPAILSAVAPVPAILSAPSPENPTSVPQSPKLFSPTLAIHSMMFSDGPNLASMLHPLILRHYCQYKKTRSFLVQTVKPATLPAKLQDRLVTMTKEMTKQINPRLSPIIESVQVGFSRKGSNVMKQR